MKLFKSSQKVLIIFLTVFLFLSCFLIIRLELKAASLQSRIDEHHKSLEKNEDVLENLNYFWRAVKNSGILVDGKSTILKSDESKVTIQDVGIDLISNGDIAIGLREKSSSKSIIYIKKDGYIHIGPNADQYLGYDKSKDVIGMFNFDSKINLSKKNVNIESKGDIRFIRDQNREFGYSADRDFIYLYHDKAYITVGTQTSPKGKNYIGVAINSPNGTEFTISDEGFLAGIPGKTGPEDDYKISISKDKFVQLRKGKSILRMEGDDIKIEALGNITITSKNGSVIINGKKVSLNE